MKRVKKNALGPAVLVTAAFIGPGTVLTASKAGSEYGFLLLWAVGFSVLATIVLQEMAARLGIVTGNGLSQAIRSSVKRPVVRFAVLGLVIVAILIGNSAYQTGNILGAASGVQALVAAPVGDQLETNESEIEPPSPAEDWTHSNLVQNALVILIAVIALTIIWIGRFDVLQGTLTGLVALMSLLFLVAAVQSSPDWYSVFAGFVPRVPAGSEWIIVGLIGTTVVPYNLFLHASAAAQQVDIDPDAANQESQFISALRRSRLETIIAVALGGLVTCAILTTASVAFHDVEAASESVGIHAKKISAYNVALQLEPALGQWSKLFFSVGLFAAGLTSSITAPIAAGFAVSGCFGWSGKLDDWRLKATATGVMVAGVLFAILMGKSPIQTIILAQVANGLLLPIIAVLLVAMANRTDLMNHYRNGKLANLLGIVVVLVSALIAVRQFNSVRGTLNRILGPEQKQSLHIEEEASASSTFNLWVQAVADVARLP